jgi:methyl-accepting chemotaxis protein
VVVGVSADGPESAADSVVVETLRGVTPAFVRERFALKFALVLVVMGLAIGAVGVAATATVTDQVRAAAESEYSNLANQEATLVEQWMERNALAVRMASDNDGWDSETDLERRIARTEAQLLPADTVALHLVERTADGWTLVATTSDTRQAGGDLAGTPLAWATDEQFDEPIGVTVSSVYVSGSDGPAVVGFASPVVGSERRYLIQEVGLAQVGVQMQGSQSARGGYTQVVDDEGTVLIDERTTEAGLEANLLGRYGDEAARQPIRDAQALGDRPSGVSIMDAEPEVIDEEYAVGYATVEPSYVARGANEWVVLVHAPTSTLFGFVQSVSRWGYIATGVGVLLVGLLGAALAYNTSTAINRVTRKAEAIEGGDFDVPIHSARVDEVGRLYDAFDEMRDALQAQIHEAERAREKAEVSRAEAIAMNTYLQETAEEYSETMRSCARGDLTERMEADGENESMDRIAAEFNDMLRELELTTGQLKTFAAEVQADGQAVQASAETVREASERVADSVQKISDDAYDQRERLLDISDELDHVSDTLASAAAEHPDLQFEEPLAIIRSIATALEEAADLADEALDETETVAGAAEDQAAELAMVSTRAEELVRYARYLGEALNNFETENEHEFLFRTDASTSEPAGESGDSSDTDAAETRTPEADEPTE